MSDDDELLTVLEVAERLKVNQQTVRNWLDRGDMRETRVGPRRIRVRESDLEAFLEQRSGANLKPLGTQAGLPPIDERRRQQEIAAWKSLGNAMSKTMSSVPHGNRRAAFKAPRATSSGSRRTIRSAQAPRLTRTSLQAGGRWFEPSTAHRGTSCKADVLHTAIIRLTPAVKVAGPGRGSRRLTAPQFARSWSSSTASRSRSRWRRRPAGGSWSRNSSRSAPKCTSPSRLRRAH